MGDMNYVKSYRKALKSDYYTKPDKYGRQHQEPKVKGLGVVMTYSPEAEGTFDQKAWEEENKKFLQELFPGCPIHLTSHKDESSVHLQGCIIPTTPEGKINKTYYIRGKKELINIQDRYAERMKQFGLERGEKGKTLERDKEEAKRARALRAENNALRDENTKLRVVVDKLTERLKTAEKALLEARESVEEYKELLWIKRTEPEKFKNIESYYDDSER